MWDQGPMQGRTFDSFPAVSRRRYPPRRDRSLLRSDGVLGCPRCGRAMNGVFNATRQQTADRHGRRVLYRGNRSRQHGPARRFRSTPTRCRRPWRGDRGARFRRGPPSHARCRRPPLAFAAGGAPIVAEPLMPADACDTPANEIVAENCLPGDTDWEITGAGVRQHPGIRDRHQRQPRPAGRLQGQTSALAYRIDIYRMGYYDGAGARKVATIQPSASLPQVQPACLSDAATGLVDCGNWDVSATWTVPAQPRRRASTSPSWCARTSPWEPESRATSTSSSATTTGQSDLLFQTSDTTWQAYNTLRRQQPVPRAARPAVPTRSATTVRSHPQTTSRRASCSTPNTRWCGSSKRTATTSATSTGVDTRSDRMPSSCEHKVFLSVGHDEYWSGRSARTSRRRATPACTWRSSAATRSSGRRAGRPASTARARRTARWSPTRRPTPTARSIPSPAVDRHLARSRASARRPTAAGRRTP